MKTRLATKTDHESIYIMGYDVWSNGTDEASYLEGCRASAKYKKGTWYVLQSQGKLLSSLIVYKFGEGVYGIGSIATAPAFRKQGFASRLIRDVIDALEDEGNKTTTIFLYSDINSKFYERFQFCRIPDHFQIHLPTVCMIRPQHSVDKVKRAEILVPPYF